MLACITLYNFMIDEGLGYYTEVDELDELTEAFPEDNESLQAIEPSDEDDVAGEDVTVQMVFLDMLQQAQYNRYVRSI